MEEIKKRIKEVLSFLPRERLMIAPDCGLGMLGVDVVERKLGNMCEAVREINAEWGEINAEWVESKVGWEC